MSSRTEHTCGRYRFCTDSRSIECFPPGRSSLFSLLCRPPLLPFYNRNIATRTGSAAGGYGRPHTKTLNFRINCTARTRERTSRGRKLLGSRERQKKRASTNDRASTAVAQRETKTRKKATPHGTLKRGCVVCYRLDSTGSKGPNVTNDPLPPASQLPACRNTTNTLHSDAPATDLAYGNKKLTLRYPLRVQAVQAGEV